MFSESGDNRALFLFERFHFQFQLFDFRAADTSIRRPFHSSPGPGHDNDNPRIWHSATAHEEQINF